MWGDDIIDSLICVFILTVQEMFRWKLKKKKKKKKKKIKFFHIFLIFYQILTVLFKLFTLSIELTETWNGVPL